MRRFQKTSILLLSLALTLVTSGIHNVAYAAEVQELRIKVGSKNAEINGSAQTIIQPYQTHGVTMVPLSIFKKAFGADIKLGDGNTVKILKGKHSISLTLGSPVIWVDGRKIRSEAAPAMLNNTFMAPLRIIASSIGASVSTGEGGQIVVRLKTEEGAEPADNEGIDTDTGKTRIGNSYYGWSMQYPSGLIPGNSSDESVATFSDSEGTYYLEIYARPKMSETADMDTLLDTLLTSASNSGETVLDQQTFEQARNPYARIITMDDDDSIWQERAYYGGGRIYTLYLASRTAKSYKDMQQYDALLDTFEPRFDSSDKSVKDLSTVTDGMVETYNEDFGLSLQIPVEWDADNSDRVFRGRNGESLSIHVASAPAGLTLDSWAGQLRDQHKRTFLPDAYKWGTAVQVEASGDKALLQQAEYTYGNGWYQEKQLMLINGGYRYLIDYTAPKELGSGTDRFQNIVDSLDIDFEGNSEFFGKLEDRRFLLDTTRTVKKSSNRYHYTVNIPLYWTAVNERYDQSQAEYQFPGGSFELEASSTRDLDLAVWQLKNYFNEAAKITRDFSLQGIENVTLAGVPATVFRIHQTVKGVPQSKQVILFSDSDDQVYQITTTLNDTNSTPEQKAALETAVKSFAWMK
ncbi:copper amine oxidase N-terminal domain-containing protein [Paenibacillus sp. YPG26]|uniref:copper amine oxidase N-terminal domain-containing protein n=1 Tax=Paenibacillus sp. YPG26 TaxID=2878915 RepID=UPI00203CA4D6|nr:copper amine oxidase N-terminal domain-containing protein [Paenibacillus sp. YPG26]USB32797.1 copper amine oxidase N-terminal domain-containing protein [Paenibacillus sp. YPG26]